MLPLVMDEKNMISRLLRKHRYFIWVISHVHEPMDELFKLALLSHVQ